MSLPNSLSQDNSDLFLLPLEALGAGRYFILFFRNSDAGLSALSMALASTSKQEFH